MSYVMKGWSTLTISGLLALITILTGGVTHPDYILVPALFVVYAVAFYSLYCFKQLHIDPDNK